MDINDLTQLSEEEFAEYLALIDEYADFIPENDLRREEEVAQRKHGMRIHGRSIKSLNLHG